VAAIEAPAARRRRRWRLALRLRRLVVALRRALAPRDSARGLAVVQAPAAARVVSLLGGLLVGPAADAVELPEDRGDAMYHLYDGGGVTAQGPALLVRKSLAEKVSLSATYYVDMVSNASIDVVTTASPYKETRTEYGLGAEYVYRNARMTLSGSSSKEPDYRADALNVDLAQDVFGGMTTVNLGFSRGADEVGRKNSPEFSQDAHHWRYRLGLTQILTPTWLANLSVEAIADDGYLGSPYRTALVFGASVPERVPSTRSSRAVKLRVLGEAGRHGVVSADYRYYWDNWGIAASTVGIGFSRYFGENVLADATLRYYTQSGALFYSNDAQAETTYVSRNRQLSTYSGFAPGLRVSYRARAVPGRYDLRLNGAYEFQSYRYDDFTDLRTGSLYSYQAHVLQLSLTAQF
jgi:hypothetical protein